MIPKPTISLHGSGESVDLSNHGGGRFVLMQGSSGLGWGPHALSTAALASGGSVLLHKRVTQAEVMIPLLLGGDYGQRHVDRRTLERLCVGEVEVRVTQPGGESRSRFGHLSDGLEGSYDSGEDSPDGQKLVLTFLCPDPFWYGSQRSESWELSPDRRQVLSQMRDTPSAAQLVRTNYVFNPSFVGDYGLAVLTGDRYQSADVSVSSANSWQGGTSWRFEITDTDGSRVGGRLDSGASGTIRYAAGVWVRPESGAGAVTVQIQALQDGKWVTTASTTHVAVNTGWLQYTTEEQAPHWGERRLVFYLSSSMFSSGDPNPIPVGTSHHVDAASLVPADQSVAHFNGDMQVDGYTTIWTGTPHESTSERWTVPASSDDVRAIPFGHIQISESTVQGAKVLDISGDADAEAVLVVTGPGEDLEVINESTGQRVFINSEIDEPITIDSRRRVQDVYSESRQDGEWWEFINDDAPLELITLRPGENRVRVVMVNADPQSKVELLYRETYRAGH